MNKILSVLVRNHAGVLSHVAGLFTRRGYNIESLVGGVTADPNIDGGFWLWAVVDNVRRGTALNAVLAVEAIINRLTPAN